MASRVALVTGASRGLGAATARRLAADGLDVVVHYHQQADGAEATRQAVEEAGRSAWMEQADLSERSGAERLFAAIGDGPGGVDVLVNNAGVYPRNKLADITFEEFDRTIRTNLYSAWNCAQLATPHMVDRKWGRIVNLSSILGQKGSRHGTHYASSKAGLIGLTKALALELAKHNITANAVAPGAIETDILSQDSAEQRARRRQVIPAGRVGEPWEIADAVAYLVSDSAAYVTGVVLSVNGGLYLP
jgi:NAD(P)-dependent dehydrogenase (short-subunit alcohol dehydrogenase family)